MARTSWRGAALWSGGIAAAIAAVVVLVALTGGGSDGPLPPRPADAAGRPSQALDRDVRRVAGRFILTAVARRNTVASWELLDPTYPGKGEHTKATWAKGDIPVVPASFPITSLDFARFNVTARSQDAMTIQVMLTPKRGLPEVFDLGLKRRGTGQNERWLVDYWMTAYEAPVRDVPR